MKPQPIPIEIERDSEIHKFDSISEGARFLGCQPGQLIQKYIKSYKGWKITILGERQKISQLKVPVYLFSESEMFVEKFESVHQCSRNILVPPRKVSELAKKEGKIPFGKYMNFTLKYQP